jgi:RNA polymerase sigma-70 factor (ECF subfamily)
LNPSQTIALYQPTLQAIAMKFLRCKADAEDVVQETFIKWLNAEQENIRNTKAYLIQSVKNNCLNHIETLKRKKEEYFDNLHLSEFLDKLMETHFPGKDLEVRIANALHLIQEKLEPLERAVYLLREVFDFDYSDLQALLDKKQEHCRQLLSRAKKKLQQEKDSFHAVMIPRKTALLESFYQACDFGNAAILINQLRTDIRNALQKNF